MTTLLVDGNNLLSRADFAAKGKNVAMSVGQVNTAALVIFINMLSKYVRLTKPTRMALYWDAGHAFRDEIYPGYKAARKKPADPQTDTVPFALAKEFLTWAGIPHKAHTGYEADDLIAVAARQATGMTVILSGDKDLLQLVRDPPSPQPGDEGHWQSVYQIRVPEIGYWDEERVEQAFGVPPHHLPAYLALVGDPGDGVPGVRGVGPKKALKALAEAGWDWESLMEVLGPERAAEARLMRSLVDLRYYDYPDILMRAHRHVPEFRPTGPTTLDLGSAVSWATLEEFCQHFALKGVLERLHDGSLWHGEESAPPSTEGLFDDLDDVPDGSEQHA